MRYFLFILTATIFFTSFGKAEVFYKIEIKNANSILNDTSKKKNLESKDEKWNIFWKSFKTAVNKKDKNRIAELTSKDFNDGGGGTVQQWLDAEVFLNDITFMKFINTVNKGTKYFKGFDGNPYKATGKNKSGDLFFEYKNNQWLFGGLVGD